ncbi:hypothetical protein JAAARDRAFT_195834 [Jaapia argillacea MUCL 33604]|uniref:F-box domain-containing protein n=1 Tax=Jaapia argillacea MUCL 33604 TaxID=933084 RepID=A0A067PYP8_9AGAM|nr:hypothetical protein JAAARDRAFT_195834 [Jaapia argillacea MUCL 33604]
MLSDDGSWRCEGLSDDGGRHSQLGYIDSALHFSDEGYGSTDDDESTDYLNGLPNELLGQIFEECCSIPSDSFDCPSPIAISLVSRRWRGIALSMSSLWTDIVLRPRLLDRATAYLSRSSHRTIDITFNAKTITSPISVDNKTNLLKAVRLLLPHIPRWRRFVLLVDFQSVLHEVAKHLAGVAAPELQSVEFLQDRLDSSRLGFEPIHTEIFAGGTPKLAQVRLRCTTLWWHCNMLSGLTTLDLGHIFRPYRQPSYAEFCDLITASPSLTHLILRLSGPVLEPEVDYLPIEIPSLRSLELADFESPALSAEYLYRLCRTLSTPNLKELKISNISEIAWINFVFAMESQAPKYPTVESVTLSSFQPINLEEGFMRSFPELKNFTAHDVQADCFIYALFAPHPPRSGLFTPIQPAKSDICWPHLQTLTLDRIRLSSLRLMISARTGMGRPIGKLRLAESIREQMSMNGNLDWLEKNASLEWFSEEREEGSRFRAAMKRAAHRLVLS